MSPPSRREPLGDLPDQARLRHGRDDDPFRRFAVAPLDGDHPLFGPA